LTFFAKTLAIGQRLKVDYVIDITPASPKVFIKTAGVRRCKYIDNFLKPLPTVSPDLRMNLAGEQAYVRQAETLAERRSTRRVS
jgi:hypothetical protein